MTTPTDSRPDLLTVIVYMRANPGKEEALRAALEALVEPSSKEEGFVNYDLHVSLADPALFYLYENWESGEALDAHFETPHLRDFVSRTDELLEGGAEGLHLERLRRIA